MSRYFSRLIILRTKIQHPVSKQLFSSAALKTINVIRNRWFSCTQQVSAFSHTDLQSSILQGKLDLHNGLIISSNNNLCQDIDDFKNRLNVSLSKWHKEGLRSVWFKVTVPQINWISVLREKGFKIHHSYGNEIYLYLWLSRNEVCKIPHYAHTMIGSGGAVINDKNQILVISEHFKSISTWKLPGGYVDVGEDICQAAQREVLEETGIKTELISLLGFRFAPKSVFGCSDFYFIVRLKPLTSEITKQNDEVEHCRWMDIDEFLSHKEVYSVLRSFIKQALINDVDQVKMICRSEEHPVTKLPQLVFSFSQGFTAG